MNSPTQHMQHLELANAVRLGRAALKRRVRAGELSVADLIGPDVELRREIESMRIAELLCAQERWGPTRSRGLLRPLAIGENRKIGSLTARERGQIVVGLNGGAVPDERYLTAYRAGAGV